MYISYTKLWKKLAESRLTKTELCQLSGISSRVMAKLAKDQTVTTDTLARICSVLHCDVADIIECKEEKTLSLYQYFKRFGTVTKEEENFQVVTFCRDKQKYKIYLSRKRATRSTRIHCKSDGTIWWEQLYPCGGHARPISEKTVLLKPEKDDDERAAILIKGKPGCFFGLEDGVLHREQIGRKRTQNFYVMPEASFKVFEFPE